MLRSPEREDISKNTIAKNVKDVSSFSRCDPRGEEEIEEKEGGDARRSTKNRRLKCVWCNYTSFAAHKTFIFVAR